MRTHLVAVVLFPLLVACGGGGGGSQPAPQPTPTPGPVPPYQPLAVGDSWQYSCAFRNPPGPGSFPIANGVTGTASVGGVKTFAFALQVVTSPSQIATETMLLANDVQGNTILYGYESNGAVLPVTPTVIVAAHPLGTYDYPGPDGTSVTRVFQGLTVTNPTALGTFDVAVYYESGGTHNYGYTVGKGIMEEDHGPNFQFDCTITAIHVN